MAKNNPASAVAGYIIVALILGVITYVEFAIVEYPQEWLGRGWTMFWLIALSVVKFIMVIMYFMHLKDDDRTYTGFFSSGMLITMATFVALTAMFILPRAVASTRPTDVQAGRATHEVPPPVLDLVETDGRSRSAAAQARDPRPMDRRVTIAAPTASNDASTYELSLPTAAPAAAEAESAEAVDEPAAEPAAEQAEEAAAPAEEPAGEAEAAAADADAEEEAATAADAEEAEEAAEAAAAPEAAEEPAAETAAAAASWDAEAGASVFAANCVACHQASGQGIPFAFPPLADHAVHMYEADGGREFLLDVVLFGMQGPIEVAGASYNGLMQAWGHLSDDDIANVLNHIVTAWDDAPAGFEPYQPGEVADQRSKGLSATDVHAIRGELGF